MIRDHYFHVPRWQPNFVAEVAIITHLPVWARFPQFPVEYYSVNWLHRAGNKIGRTLKIDMATLDALRGEYARACVEVDLRLPLMTACCLKGRQWSVQYEELHLICFHCSRYGHSEVSCPIKRSAGSSDDGFPTHPTSRPEPDTFMPKPADGDQIPPFQVGMIVEHNRKRSDRFSWPPGRNNPLQSVRENWGPNRSPLDTTTRDKGKSVASPTAWNQPSGTGGSHSDVAKIEKEIPNA